MGRVVALAVVLGSVSVTATDAGPITFHFTGVVETVVDLNSELDGSIVSGTLMIGSLTFELSTADTNSASNIGPS